ncbi:MAG: hypothetical protein ACK550_07860, partial [Synechococcaceae cyanobacterium]
MPLNPSPALQQQHDQRGLTAGRTLPRPRGCLQRRVNKKPRLPDQGRTGAAARRPFGPWGWNSADVFLAQGLQ